MANAWDVEQVFFDGHMVLMTWILAALTFKGINSAVLFLQFVFSPLLIREGIVKLLKISARGKHQYNLAFYVFMYLFHISYKNYSPPSKCF